MGAASMARGLTRKEIKKDEFMEAATDAGEWLENNWKSVLTWAAGLAVLALIVTGWHFYSKARDEAAQALLGQGIQAFSAASDRLTGTAEDYGRAVALFEQAGDKSGSADTDAVADLYRAIALARTDNADQAVTLLVSITGGHASPIILQTAQAVLAGLYEGQGELQKAEEIYLDLSASTTGVYPPAQALLNVGMVRKSMGRDTEARKLFEGIVKDYPQSAAAARAREILGN
jgi:TolA-binding protein